MTADEAITWLRRHSCVVIFHERKTIVLRPRERIKLHDGPSSNGHISVSFPFGCTFGYSEFEDEPLAAVVGAVRATWGEKAGVVDALADAVDSEQPAAELRISGHLKETFPGLGLRGMTDDATAPTA